MPHNRSETKEHQQNSSSITEKEIGTKPGKMGEKPPSLNGVDKRDAT